MELPIVTEVEKSSEIRSPAADNVVVHEALAVEETKESEKYVIDWSKATFHNSHADSRNQEQEVNIEDHAHIKVDQNISQQMSPDPNESSTRNPFQV